MRFAKYKGINKFGLAYKIMIENDIHAPNSVDRIIVKEGIFLCLETAKYLYSTYTPVKVDYQNNSRPVLENYLKKIIANLKKGEEKVRAIAEFCKELAKTNATLFGGTEEEIIKRGSDWCADLARVGCILFQIAGLPSRLAFLANTDKAYSGHNVVEVYRNNKWGVVDTIHGIIYLNKNKQPLSVWDLMNNLELIKFNIKKSFDDEKIGQFKNAAISNYFVKDSKKYRYTKSKINDYYRLILNMSSRGWPGGVRWLYGEDEKFKKPFYKRR